MVVLGNPMWSITDVERIMLYGLNWIRGTSLNLFSGTVDPAEPLATNAMLEALKFHDLLLSVFISLGTYVGSVRHIKRVHEDLKNHISEKTSQQDFR